MSLPKPTHDTKGAARSRRVSPSYGWCGRCGLSWRFVDGHVTNYHLGHGIFPLCESCWTLLGSPEERMPYYRALVDQWDDEEVWPAIKAAVLQEVGP